MGRERKSLSEVQAELDEWHALRLRRPLSTSETDEYETLIELELQLLDDD